MLQTLRAYYLARPVVRQHLRPLSCTVLSAGKPALPQAHRRTAGPPACSVVQTHAMGEGCTWRRRPAAVYCCQLPGRPLLACSPQGTARMHPSGRARRLPRAGWRSGTMQSDRQAKPGPRKKLKQRTPSPSRPCRAFCSGYVKSAIVVWHNRHLQLSAVSNRLQPAWSAARYASCMDEEVRDPSYPPCPQVCTSQASTGECD